jgi:hypothetical protein
MMKGYQIADEPAPSTFARYAVNPLYPMLAMMFAGVWFAWPWFAFNSFAVGSPTRRAELGWLVAGLFVPAGVGMALLLAREAGLLPRFSTPYVGLIVILLKLVVVYAVYLLQSRTIEIYEYYGGKLVNGVWPLLAALYLGDRLLADLPVLLFLALS